MRVLINWVGIGRRVGVTRKWMFLSCVAAQLRKNHASWYSEAGDCGRMLQFSQWGGSMQVEVGDCGCAAVTGLSPLAPRWCENHIRSHSAAWGRVFGLCSRSSLEHRSVSVVHDRRRHAGTEMLDVDRMCHPCLQVWRGYCNIALCHGMRIDSDVTAHLGFLQ